MRTFLSERLRLLVLFVFLTLIFTACGVPSIPFRSATNSSQNGYSRLPNGERIYFTATNSRGERISYTGGPASGSMMMGSYLTCSACHGQEARGGVYRIHMQVVEAPDIRYSALSTHVGEHGEDEEVEHSDYDLDVFRLAVVEGKHPDGKQLSRDMPRWQISEKDLEDLFDYLKKIP
jgi:hypothetical protein